VVAELHERFTNGLFEARRHQGEQAEFHRGENKQSRRAEEKSEADRINQIRIEFFNMPVFAVEMSDSKLGEKPKPKELETGSGFLDIIEMILEMIVEGAKAVFSKRKGGPVNS
jgi:hypothetical protein